MTAGGYHEPVRRIREGSGGALTTGTSLRGASIPVEVSVRESDFPPLHGNRVCGPDGIRRMVRECRGAAACRGRPVPSNGDDRFDFDRNDTHFPAAAGEHAARGCFDCRSPGKGDDVFRPESDQKRGLFRLLPGSRGTTGPRQSFALPAATRVGSPERDGARSACPRGDGINAEEDYATRVRCHTP